MRDLIPPRPMLRIALLCGVLTLVAACGVKGKPLPPELRIPRAPTKRRAEVTPWGIRLTCQVPQRYTDGSPLRDLDVLEIWRSDKPPEECPGCPSKRRKIGEAPYVYAEGVKVARGSVEYLDEGLKPGTYGYRVIARTRRGIRGKASRLLEVYWDIPPRVVETLRVQAGDGQVELEWKPVTERSDGQPLKEVVYQVFRGEKGKGLSPAPLNASSLGEARFRDTNVQNNLVYTYRVRAIRPVGDRWVSSLLSTPVEAMPQDLLPPAPPEGLVAFPTDKAIRLVWEGGVATDITGYNVYRATSLHGPWERLTSEPMPTVVFEDPSVKPGTWYWYSVTALDDATPPNESRRSRPAKGRIPPKPP